MTYAAIQIDLCALAAEVKQQARALGFDLVGIASAKPSAYRDYFRQWLDEGRHGTMDYLSRRFEERTDPTVYLPGARSVICVAMNYHVPLDENSPSTQPQGKIARYALGDDYHELIKSRLHKLADWIKQHAPEAETRCAVDTAPVMEKELAARAGIGWLGKNTCVINPQIGSWILLGEVLTTLPLPPDMPAEDHCGTCRRCIEACPTQAITEPYKLDATRCISYLTIEHRGEHIGDTRGEPDLARTAQIGDWLYGCDICQDVCPWNNRASTTAEPGFQPRFSNGTIDVTEVLCWQPAQYSATLRGSAMKRVKLPILQRNARVVQGNFQPADGR